MKEGYRRVTEIISPFTGIEFVPKEYLVPAAKRGTKVHDIIEAFIEGIDCDIPENTIPYIESFKKFWSDSSHIFDKGQLLLEKRFYCDELKITGMIDCMVLCKDRTYIVDWKTSSVPSISWRLQGAAYRYLCEVNGYPNVDNVLFVHLSKHGTGPSLKKYESYKSDLDIFKKCFELYHFFSMEKTRKGLN